MSMEFNDIITQIKKLHPLSNHCNQCLTLLHNTQTARINAITHNNNCTNSERFAVWIIPTTATLHSSKPWPTYWLTCFTTYVGKYVSSWGRPPLHKVFGIHSTVSRQISSLLQSSMAWPQVSKTPKRNNNIWFANICTTKLFMLHCSWYAKHLTGFERFLRIAKIWKHYILYKNKTEKTYQMFECVWVKFKHFHMCEIYAFYRQINLK